MKRALLLGAIFWSAGAWAQQKAMVLVNLNYSRDEYNLLQQLAQQRGQKLYVIPSMDLASSTNTTQIISAKAALEAAVKAAGPGLPQATVDNIIFGLTDQTYRGYLQGHDQLVQRVQGQTGRYMTLRNQMVQSEQSRPSVREQIQNTVRDLKARGEQIEDVVLSGHSDGSNFFSDTSIGLSDRDIVALRESTPELFREPSHVMLLGCYSNTEVARRIWRNTFPNASMIAGFSGRSPAGIDPRDHRYIREMLNTAYQVDAQRNLTPDQVQRTFSALASFNQTSAAIDYCGNYFAQNRERLSCDEQWLNFYRWQEHFDVYNQYLGYYNHPPAQDPPRQVDGTPVRAFYSSLQSLCPISDAPSYRSQAKYWDDQRLALRDSLLRVIFWWNIQKCFASAYLAPMREFQSFLSAQGIDLQIPRLDGNTGRIEYVRFYTQLIEALERKAGISSAEIAAIKTDEERKALDERLLRSLNPSSQVAGMFNAFFDLYYLNSNIPSNWAEMNPSTVLARPL